MYRTKRPEGQVNAPLPGRGTSALMSRPVLCVAYAPVHDTVTWSHYLAPPVPTRMMDRKQGDTAAAAAARQVRNVSVGRARHAS